MKKDRSLTVIIFAMVTSAALAYSIYLLGTVHHAREVTEGSQRFVTLSEGIATPFFFFFLSAFLCFVGCVGCFFLKAEKKWFAVIPSVILLLSPMYFLVAAIDDAASLQDAVTLQASDNHEYHLLISHLMQGSELIIGRVESRFGGQTRFEVLADSPWEESFGYLTIVRPTGPLSNKQTENGAALYISSGQVLLGVPSGGNGVFLAYDLNNKIAYGQVTAGNHVRELSPFLLIGADDTLNSNDVKEVLTYNGYSFPELKAVEPDLKNPNPAVRSLAQQLVTLLQKELKKS